MTCGNPFVISIGYRGYRQSRKLKSCRLVVALQVAAHEESLPWVDVVIEASDICELAERRRRREVEGAGVITISGRVRVGLWKCVEIRNRCIVFSGCVAGSGGASLVGGPPIHLRDFCRCHRKVPGSIFAGGRVRASFIRNVAGDETNVAAF